VFLEIDESGLARAGMRVNDVMSPLRSAGYLCYMFVKRRLSPALDDSAVEQIVRHRGYQDFLFIHRERIRL
jgi:hypothetical protein